MTTRPRDQVVHRIIAKAFKQKSCQNILLTSCKVMKFAGSQAENLPYGYTNTQPNNQAVKWPCCNTIKQLRFKVNHAAKQSSNKVNKLKAVEKQMAQLPCNQLTKRPYVRAVKRVCCQATKQKLVQTANRP